MLSFTTLLLSFALAKAAPSSWQPSLSFKGPSNAHMSNVANVHVEYLQPDNISGKIVLAYGDCGIPHHSSAHHVIGEFVAEKYEDKPTRFVWLTPDHVPTGGCLHAFSDLGMLGQSDPIDFHSKPLHKRNTLDYINNPYGAWFDGVKYLQAKEPNSTFVAGAKNKKIGIIGAGIAGLTSGLLLDSVGMHNWHISEASDRIGGRLRTIYLNGTEPEDYVYQEQGPMRFPVSLTWENETLEIQDHKIVFQLASVLNEMNKDKAPEREVTFYPWIQSYPNNLVYTDGVRNADGTVPTRTERPALVAANPPTEVDESEALTTAEHNLEEFIGFDDKAKLSATNIFKAHKQAIEDGLMDWSEALYLAYNQGLDASETSAAFGTGTLWDDIYDEVYFNATKWLTIDKGLNRLAEAFHPVVDSRLTYGRRIEKIDYDTESNKTKIFWRSSPSAKEQDSETYDKTLVAVPFTVARLWRIPSTIGPIMQEAINSLGYSEACKVSLMFKTRFWEHLEKPIYGGCSSNDIPGIGSVCYPSYKFNATGPGALLASYNTPFGPQLSGLTEEQHVALVVNAIEELHGPIAREQYTGVYHRQCWGNDANQLGSWASPYIKQHERYMPEYHKTHEGHIFIGEHTSVLHAWIFSAVESACRGVVQLLLDEGLVDEAKQIVDTWFARWLSV